MRATVSESYIPDFKDLVWRKNKNVNSLNNFLYWSYFEMIVLEIYSVQ